MVSSQLRVHASHDRESQRLRLHPWNTPRRYWLDPYSLFLIEVILVQFAELRRWQDYRHPGSMGKQYFLGLESVLGGSGDPSYPGAPQSQLAAVNLHMQAQLKDHGP